MALTHSGVIGRGGAPGGRVSLVPSVEESDGRAALNGVEETVLSLGRPVADAAATGAERVGAEAMARLLRASLRPDPDWDSIEQEWYEQAEFSLLEFINANASHFFEP